MSGETCNHGADARVLHVLRRHAPRQTSERRKCGPRGNCSPTHCGRIKINVSGPQRANLTSCVWVSMATSSHPKTSAQSKQRRAGQHAAILLRNIKKKKIKITTSARFTLDRSKSLSMASLMTIYLFIQQPHRVCAKLKKQTPHFKHVSLSHTHAHTHLREQNTAINLTG